MLCVEVACALIGKDVALWRLHAADRIAVHVGQALRGCVLMDQEIGHRGNGRREWDIVRNPVQRYVVVRKISAV